MWKWIPSVGLLTSKKFDRLFRRATSHCISVYNVRKAGARVRPYHATSLLTPPLTALKVTEHLPQKIKVNCEVSGPGQEPRGLRKSVKIKLIKKKKKRKNGFFKKQMKSNPSSLPWDPHQLGKWIYSNIVLWFIYICDWMLCFLCGWFSVSKMNWLRFSFYSQSFIIICLLLYIGQLENVHSV